MFVINKYSFYVQVLEVYPGWVAGTRSISSTSEEE
jgi:hypothetical protein